MELAFDNRELRNICETEAMAKAQLGDLAAEALNRRLADLRAAATINDLVATRPSQIAGSTDEHLVIELIDGCRMVLCANHPKNPVIAAGGIDWTKVFRVKILSIEVSNDN